MGYFDGLRERLTNTGQSAIQKTRNLAGENKLNQEIRELQDRNREAFEALGRLYYDRYSDVNQDEDIGHIIEVINENYFLIERKLDEINALKGMIMCPNCGASVPAEDTFCTNCGTRLPGQPQQDDGDLDLRQCPFCGARIEEDARFCSECGGKVS